MKVTLNWDFCIRLEKNVVFANKMVDFNVEM